MRRSFDNRTVSENRRSFIVQHELSNAPAVPDGGYASVFGPLDLAGAQMLAKGADRCVFQHPHVPSLLVKVINTENYAAYLARRPLKRFYKQFQRAGACRVYLDELSEYVSTSAGMPGAASTAPLARVVGVAQTSMGLGQLVEKITAEDGRIAPTLAQVFAHEGVTGAMVQRLDAFFDALIEAHVVINDMSAKNIALGRNADGKAGMYLIDGFGVLPLIPLYAWSKRLNRRRMRRKYAHWLARMQREYGKGPAQSTTAP